MSDTHYAIVGIERTRFKPRTYAYGVFARAGKRTAQKLVKTLNDGACPYDGEYQYFLIKEKF